MTTKAISSRPRGVEYQIPRPKKSLEWKRSQGIMLPGPSIYPQNHLIRINQLISRQSITRYFGIKKTEELVVWKYYEPIFRVDIESYINRYNICWTSKST